MTSEDIKKIAFGLNNHLRLKILQILAIEPRSAVEVFRIIKRETPVYRQSVHRALEILKGCNLVEKEYNSSKKALIYKLRTNKVELIFESMEVIFSNED